MPYMPIPAAWIEAGKPTKEEIFEYLSSNQESFNADIELLKQSSTISVFNARIHGSFSEYDEAELVNILPVFRAPVTATITEVRLAGLESGNGSGTLSIQLDKSTDGGFIWNPILAAPVTMSAFNAGGSSGGVSFVTGGADFSQNDMIRIRIISSTSTLKSFHINVYGELA